MKDMKLSKVFSLKALIVLFTIVCVFTLIPIFSTKANALTAVYFFLSRMATNIAGVSPTVEYTLAIAPNQTIATAGTVVIIFPDADDGMWCRTAGSLTVTGVASSIVDLAATNWAIDAALPTSGTLAASCTIGSGASSYDTITISAVGTLTGGTTYGVKLANGSSAGVLGTDDTAGTHTVTVKAQSGVVIDSGTFDLYLVATDTVTVSATVQAVPTVNCSISSSSVSLGTLFPGGAFNSITNTLSTSTSTSASGYYWSAFGTGDGSTDAGLWKSDATTYLIPSTGSTTINLNTGGVQGFGITLSDPDGAGAAVIPADFSDAVFGTVGALDRATTGAQVILYQNGAQTSPDVSTVTYVGKAGGSAEAGSYQEVIYFQCGGYY
jgi:hypothetical protein